jgi:hypothetical protein
MQQQYQMQQLQSQKAQINNTNPLRHSKINVMRQKTTLTITEILNENKLIKIFN